MTATFTHTQQIATPDDMHELGLLLARNLQAGDLVILNGPLGAGKTTLARAIGEGLGVRGPVTSPTFVIARTHPSLTDGPSLVHVDAYRLTDPDEFDDLDLDLDSAVVLVEWGRDMVRPLDSWLDVDIARPTGADDPPVDADAQELIEPRLVHLTGFGSRWTEGLNT